MNVSGRWPYDDDQMTVNTDWKSKIEWMNEAQNPDERRPKLVSICSKYPLKCPVSL